MSRHLLITIAAAIATVVLAGCAEGDTTEPGIVQGAASPIEGPGAAQRPTDTPRGTTQGMSTSPDWPLLEGTATTAEEHQEPRPDPWHNVQRAASPKPLGRTPNPDDVKAPDSARLPTK